MIPQMDLSPHLNQFARISTLRDATGGAGAANGAGVALVDDETKQGPQKGQETP